MDDSIYTETIFEPAVSFTSTAADARGQQHSSVGATRAFIGTAVASAALSAALLIVPFTTAVSGNVVHPSALNLSSDAIDATPGVWRVRFDQRVRQLLDLPADWESGASQVSAVAAEALREMLSEAEVPGLSPPSVVPTVEGGLQVEWHENGVDVEVRSTPSGEIFAFYIIGDDEREIVVKKPRQLRRLLRHLVFDQTNA